MNAFTWCFGCRFLQMHLGLINECIVVALSRGRVAAMHRSQQCPVRRLEVIVEAAGAGEDMLRYL